MNIAVLTSKCSNRKDLVPSTMFSDSTCCVTVCCNGALNFVVLRDGVVKV